MNRATFMLLDHGFLTTRLFRDVDVDVDARDGSELRSMRIGIASFIPVLPLKGSSPVFMLYRDSCAFAAFR